jgi:hypothetical protein
MHEFLSVNYFTLLLLHISATVCHPQGARLYLLRYMPIWVLVDKILCNMWLCVRYVAAWCVPATVRLYTILEIWYVSGKTCNLLLAFMQPVLPLIVTV